MDFSRFTSMNTRLLARYGGNVTLSRWTPGEPDPDPRAPPPEPVLTSETLLFIATDAASELLAAGKIQAGDLVGVMAVPATAALNPPKLMDLIAAGGVTYTILGVSPVHSDPGDVIHYAIQGRA